jgi:hypothetical protein
MFLMLRTYLSLVVARLDGEIVRDLVAGNGRSFIWGIIKVSFQNCHPPLLAVSLCLETNRCSLVVRYW